MKKIINILSVIFILLLFYLTKDINMLSFTFSFGMYLLFYSIFSTTSIKGKLEKYCSKKYYYSASKIFKYSIIWVGILGIFLTAIAYLIGMLLKIDNLSIINVFMSISILSSIILKLISEYLNGMGYKKIGNNLVNLYAIIVLSVDIIFSILAFKAFRVASYLIFISFYLVNIIIFIVIVILFYIMFFKKKNIKTREENKINYVSDMKGVIVNNSLETMVNLIKSSYVYISMIILYYALINRYNYDYEQTATIITNTFFFGVIIIYFIYDLINKKLNINYSNIEKNFNIDIIKIVKVSLNLCILLVVLSVPINNLLFKNEHNVLISLIPLLFVYILYDYIININVQYGKVKNTMFILISGLFVKIIFELPFINSAYRMGYALISGSILSTILGLIISVIIGGYFIKNRFGLNLSDNFTNLLNIIYESIIYALILTVLTLVVKIDVDGIFENILVVFFYLFISFLFFLLKRILIKK